jgi:DMSO/TMAO reductase YedYZ molybdopterin-dependent catalytic subunit
MKEQTISNRQYKVRSLFAFSFFVLALCAGVFVWIMLRKEPRDTGIPATLRKGLMIDERIFSGLFSQNKLVKTYPKSEAVKQVRVNGDIGLKDPIIDTATWRLQVIRSNGDTSYFSLDDIKRLPKTEIVYDFKCIEGWSQKTWWGGVRFSDFLNYYHLNNEAMMRYVGLNTPDKEYYVGIDMPSILQPQTLLCYEMNGKTLPVNQGYPLRLIIPVKYGIKHLKRIGTIYFSDNPPPDYWAERGYDYYAGH